MYSLMRVIKLVIEVCFLFSDRKSLKIIICIIPHTLEEEYEVVIRNFGWALKKSYFFSLLSWIEDEI